MGKDAVWVKLEFITQGRWALFFVNTRAFELTREEFVKVSWKVVRCCVFAQRSQFCYKVVLDLTDHGSDNKSLV